MWYKIFFVRFFSFFLSLNNIYMLCFVFFYSQMLESDEIEKYITEIEKEREEEAEKKKQKK